METIERILRDLEIQESQLKLFENCLERCNYIVEVGAYTLGSDNGAAKYELKNTPTHAVGKRRSGKNSRRVKRQGHQQTYQSC